MVHGEVVYDRGTQARLTGVAPPMPFTRLARTCGDSRESGKVSQTHSQQFRMEMWASMQAPLKLGAHHRENAEGESQVQEKIEAWIQHLRLQCSSRPVLFICLDSDF